MVTKEEMKNQLSGVGIMASDEILELCCEFCLRNNIDEANFVDSWVSFAFSELSSNLNITPEGVQQMERKQFDTKFFSTPKQVKNGRSFTIKTPNQETTPKRKKLLPQFHASSPGEGLSFSPTSYSPVVKDQRDSNIPSGQVLLCCGKSSCDWKSNHSYSPELKSYYPKENGSWKYMYDVLYDIWNLNEDFCEEISKRIVTLNELPEPEPFSSSFGENSVFVGRVILEEGRINSQNVEIQGIGSSCHVKMEVDMSQITDFSLFPGQVVAFKGFREGKKVIATQLYISGRGPTPEFPSIKIVIQLVVAAGPFDQSGDAFNSIIKYVIEHQPNYFFLIGPLLDSTNQHTNIDDFAETFDSYHFRALSQISNSLKASPTKFFFISSPKDVVSLPVYPIAPVGVSHVNDSHTDINVMSDPSLLNIDGLIVGFTSVDSLLHLSKKEVSNCKGNRLARLAGHLIHQQTFYPLFPSDLDVGIDINLWYKYARIPAIPHILVLPSDLHFFVKNVEGCLVINPERIVKGCTRGSFAHIEANPYTDVSTWNVDSHISVKIIKA